MRRKAAFFRRIAAMQCVQDGARSAWEECYNLLLQTFAGYKMSVDPKVFPQGEWERGEGGGEREGEKWGVEGRDSAVPVCGRTNYRQN